MKQITQIFLEGESPTLSSIHSIVKYEEFRCLKNVIHQIDSKNEWLVASASFTAKFEFFFALTLENAFS